MDSDELLERVRAIPGVMEARIMHGRQRDRLYVKVVGHHAAKLAIIARVGVVTKIASGALPIAAYDWVVDATGSPEGLRSAAAMTRPRGTVILKSTVHGAVVMDTAPIIVNELTLVGSRCGRFGAALPLLNHPSSASRN